MDYFGDACLWPFLESDGDSWDNGLRGCWHYVCWNDCVVLWACWHCRSETLQVIFKKHLHYFWSNMVHLWRPGLYLARNQRTLRGWNRGLDGGQRTDLWFSFRTRCCKIDTTGIWEGCARNKSTCSKNGKQYNPWWMLQRLSKVNKYFTWCMFKNRACDGIIAFAAWWCSLTHLVYHLQFAWN